MGKHGGGHKLSDEYKEKVRLLGKPVEAVINDLPVKTLLRIGKRVCSYDYAVHFYYNKQHPKFHLNKEALKHAIRRAWAVNHQEQVIDILENEGLIREYEVSSNGRSDN